MVNPITIRISELLGPERILDLPPLRRDEILARMCQTLAGDHRVADAAALHDSILARERQASTAVGLGIAIPHVKIAQVSDYVMAAARIREGIDFQALDHKPVHLVFMICASDHQTREFVRLLAQVTHLLKNDVVRRQLLETEIPNGFHQIIRDAEL